MRTLIVENKPSCLKRLDKLLRPYGDRVLATTGKEALRMFRTALEEESPFDLVCLGITIPEINAHAVLKRIRSLETAKGILGADGAKVAMITTCDDLSSIMKTFREQCEAYLPKPVTEEKLRNLLISLGLVEGSTQLQ